MFRRDTIRAAGKRYQESLKGVNAKVKRSGVGRKKKPWYAKKGQKGPWKKCKFARCKAPHKETRYKGHCSRNCQSRKQIDFKTGFQFDLGHSVRSGWERKYAQYLQHEKGYKLNVDYKYEPRRFYLGKYKGSNLYYMPDFYLIPENLWIEVKGYMTAKNTEQIKRFRAKGNTLEVIGSKFIKSKRFRINK